MGVRENGSSVNREIDLHEAEDGGSDIYRAHVLTDSTAHTGPFGSMVLTEIQNCIFSAGFFQNDRYRAQESGRVPKDGDHLFRPAWAWLGCGPSLPHRNW